MSEPRDQARAAGQITLPIAEAVVLVAQHPIVKPDRARLMLKIHLDRDAQGNVKQRIEEDKQGHVRESWVTYETEGVFPSSVTNGLDQASFLVFDPGSGQPLVERDINGHVRKWGYDGFGLLTEVHAINGNVTTVSTTRQKGSGGGIADFWQTQITRTTPGQGVDREVLDSGGRVVERPRRRLTSWR